MSFETLAFSLYSDISTLMSALLSQKNSRVRTFTSSVFPTHVGPSSKKLQMGRFLSAIQVLLRFIELTIALIASSCPMICFAMLDDIFLSLSRSSIVRFSSGIQVI